MKRLSVIIPVYNVEPYIEKCLRSLGNQDIPENDYEIICINDGSPDNSLKIIQELQKEYDNIIVIDQQNQGVSRARNNGMDIANGRYLLFVDPDDSVEPAVFKRVIERAEETEAEISFLGFTVLDKVGKVKTRVLNERNSSGVYLGTDAYSLARENGRTDPDRIWAVLVDREFLNRYRLRFLEDVPYLEDGELITRILCLADRCIFDGRSFYIRTTRPGSATNSKLFNSSKAVRGFLNAAVNLKQFQGNNDLERRQYLFLNQPICKFVALTIDSLRKPFVLKELLRTTDDLDLAGLKRLDLKTVNREYSILGWTYNRSVFLLVMYQFFLSGVRSLVYRLNEILSGSGKVI